MKNPLALSVVVALSSSLGFAQTEVHKFVASSAAVGAAFGHAVDVDGNLAIVGARDAIINRVATGAAYIYDVTTGQELLELLASDGGGGDKFGFSVAIGNGIALVGSPHHEVLGQDDAGTVYIFDLSSGVEIGRLVPVITASESHFGIGVDMDNGKAVVGAFTRGPKGTDSGEAFIFDIATQVQEFSLVATDGAPGDYMGWTVAISGNQALVGADKDDDMGKDSGSAYLFDVSTGAQIAKLLPLDGKKNDRFGWKLDLQNGTAVVSAHKHNGTGGADSGAIYVFDAATATQIAKYEAADGQPADEFGFTVDLQGSRIAVGAPLDDFGLSLDVGSAYVLDLGTGAQEFKIAASDGATVDLFGSSVSLDGNHVLVGSIWDDDSSLNAGSAYLYDITPPCYTKYCTVGSGSLNNTTNLDATGCDLSGAICLNLSNGPRGQFCCLFIGSGTSVVTNPGSTLGDLCILGGTVLRYKFDLGAVSPSGAFSLDISDSVSGGPGYGIPGPGAAIQSGETWNFQYWHGNPVGQAAGFTEAVAITFK